MSDFDPLDWKMLSSKIVFDGKPSIHLKRVLTLDEIQKKEIEDLTVAIEEYIEELNVETNV